MDHYLKEEHFLREYTPSMSRVLKRENHRGSNSNFNRKNRHSQVKSKARWKSSRRERFRQKVCRSDVNDDSETYHNYRHEEQTYYSYNSYHEHSYCSPTILQPAARRNEWDDMHQILPAEELGIDEGQMYDRLISILQGDEITPEDYDLLRQLDNNNVRTTLDESKISQFPSFAICDVGVDGGVNSDDGNHYKQLLTNSLKCDICLESWSDLPKNTEVRCLPCNHLFCKNCIDDWLSQRSHKCPNLSCYWSL